jgi:integrase
MAGQRSGLHDATWYPSRRGQRSACFRQVAEDAGLRAEDWTPRELRHSFVSLLSSAGIPIEDIAHLVGHANTRTTEKVYRKELRPVLRRGAKAMDDLFKAHQKGSEPPNLPPASSENQTER